MFIYYLDSYRIFYLLPQPKLFSTESFNAQKGFFFLKNFFNNFVMWHLGSVIYMLVGTIYNVQCYIRLVFTRTDSKSLENKNFLRWKVRSFGTCTEFENCICLSIQSICKQYVSCTQCWKKDQSDMLHHWTLHLDDRSWIPNDTWRKWRKILPQAKQILNGSMLVCNVPQSLTKNYMYVR